MKSNDIYTTWQGDEKLGVPLFSPDCFVHLFPYVLNKMVDNSYRTQVLPTSASYLWETSSPSTSPCVRKLLGTSLQATILPLRWMSSVSEWQNVYPQHDREHGIHFPSKFERQHRLLVAKHNWHPTGCVFFCIFFFLVLYKSSEHWLLQCFSSTKWYASN